MTSTLITRFLTTPWSAIDASTAVVLLKKEAQSKLSDKDKQTFRKDAIEALSPIFQLTSLNESENQLSVNYSLGMRVNDLRKCL